MTQWLAEQVVPDGWVHAIDQNKEQLAIAQQNSAKLNNVSSDKRSVYDPDALTQQYDAVYSRFLLVHLDEPYKATNAHMPQT